MTTKMRMTAGRPAATIAAVYLLAALAVPLGAAEYVADPDASPGQPGYYRDLVSQLTPGDTLRLPAGTYTERLNLRNLQGLPDAWITIAGPESGPPAVITTESTCCNTVQLGNTSFVALENLTIDSNTEALGVSIDAINAKDDPTHDIRIEGCTIQGVSHHQQTVGISTKSVAWNWVVRNNTILEAGTGMYLGNSNGEGQFIAGIIEGNLFVDTIGYNMEIKYQNPYSLSGGMPSGPNRTIIRNNVFLKRKATTDWPPQSDGDSRISGARPNVLVGGFPSSGPGSNDLYEIYANFFFMNPDESLFQGSGRMSIHDNVFVKQGGTAVQLQNHDLPLKLAHVYNNTIYGTDRGIRFGTAASEDDAVVGNLVFAADPIGGSLRTENRKDNLTDSVANAPNHVSAPSFVLGSMDFYPLAGEAQGPELDLSPFAGETDRDFDFNGDPKGTVRFRGAYAGEGANPGWQLDEGRKQGGPSSGPIDPPPAPPAPPVALRVI